MLKNYLQENNMLCLKITLRKEMVNYRHITFQMNLNHRLHNYKHIMEEQ